MVAVPPMMMVMEPRAVVPILVIMSILNTSWVAVQSRRHIVPGLVAPLVAGATLGVPLGIYLLTLTASGDALFKALVGVVMILLAAVMFLGWRRPLKNRHAALYPVGFVSGVMNGSISILGPPVILFLANQDTPKDIFRANIVTYFTLTNVVSLFFFGSFDLLTRDVLLYSAGFAPFLIIATFLGVRISGRISPEAFRRLTLICVTVGGLVLLIKNGMTLV